MSVVLCTHHSTPEEFSLVHEIGSKTMQGGMASQAVLTSYQPAINGATLPSWLLEQTGCLLPVGHQEDAPWAVPRGAYAPSREGAMRCAGDGGKLKPSCGRNARRYPMMSCMDTSATGRRCSSTTGRGRYSPRLIWCRA